MPRRKPPATPKPDAPPVPTEKLLTNTRPRWEYRAAASEDGLCYYDGKPATPVRFNDLGADGWELVTIYPVGDAMHAPVYYAVFKREVRDG